MNSVLGQAIRLRMVEARRAAKLSQEQAAANLDPPVARQTISKWETGITSPNPREFAQLCVAYKVSADLILRPTTGSDLVDKILGAPARDFENSTK